MGGGTGNTRNRLLPAFPCACLLDSVPRSERGNSFLFSFRAATEKGGSENTERRARKPWRKGKREAVREGQREREKEEGERSRS